MTEKEITKKLEEINQCMIELQEAKFHDAPKDIIQQLQQKIDVLIKESGRDEGYQNKFKDE
tara:strand:+ start:1009 stop:1191 length:183 start_codon:yes stop_codon:yes gene_type:complete